MASDDSANAEESVNADEEPRFRPAVCYWRILLPITCWFRVHSDSHGGKGGVPALTMSQWKTLFVVSMCGLLSAADWEIFPLVLTAIQVDLRIPEASLGIIGSAVRLGNMLAFPISSLGDRYGRRVVMLASSVAFLLLSAGTGIAQDVYVFTTLQVIARGFIQAQTTLATTIIVEAFNAVDRGWGVGVYSAVAILGNASTLILYGFIGDIPGFWRWLYGSSLFILIPLVAFGRIMPESKRFTKMVSEGANAVALDARSKRVYTSRLAVCALVSFCNGFAFAPSTLFLLCCLLPHSAPGACFWGERARADANTCVCVRTRLRRNVQDEKVD